ncbi:hypothetical protein [Opitutus sp. GAS368]|uniref:hypothetical protein n=1 Tax=Opitutus sp. GAS368 TaxID=1882749 RepID=UPI00087CD061|nr:hypothetical protein [Opitutus sp. GAS368]SDS43784.1 hypothetical protein SAMN05444173_2893 [Opitutus sp. GAS368]
MKVTLADFIRPAGLLAGALLALAGGTVRAADKLPSDAFPDFESYIKISGQAASITGNEAAFQTRTKQDANGGAGIEDLHFAKDVTKTTTLTLDGRALTGAEDYLGRVNLTKTDVGSVDFGYKRFRTFYDGAGGFFPTNKEFMTLPNEDLHIDRAKFWVEANLALPNAPTFKLRYTNELRDGRKDSTIWGDTDFTGLPFTVAPNPITQVRKIVPSYLQVSERHELLELSSSYKIKKTEIELTLLADRTDNDDIRYVTRFPGEVIPFSIVSLASAAQPAAKALLTPNNWNNQVAIAENDAMKTKTTGFNLATSTELTDKVTLKVNGNYELVHTEIGGGRPLITQTATATGIVPVATDNYQGLSGGTRVKNYVGNIALDLKPIPALFVKLAFRAQDEFIHGVSSYNVVAASGTPAVTLTSTPRTGWAKIHQNVRTPVLEFRYTGIKDLALYFTGSKRSLSGDENNTSSYNPLTATVGTPAVNSVSEDHGNYTLGANWRQSARLTLRGEVFHKDHKDSTVGYGTLPAIVGDYYLLDSQYTGFKLTALAKLTDQLAFTTRFISQKGRMQVTGFLPTYPAYDSLDAKNYMIAETIDWNPNAQVYVQVNGTATYQVISTIYPRAGVTPATPTVNAFDTNGVLHNSDNNYVTGSFLTGFVLNKNTDVQIQLNYYRADNGNAYLAAMTTPYGVAVRDVSYTVGVKHKLTDKLLLNAKLGYFDSQNDTTGGFTNYHGPVAYVAFDRSF